MHTGRTVFSQLLDFLPRHEFDLCVRRYRGNYRVRGFSCLDRFLGLCSKAFYGTSANAVKTRVWIAISTHVLVAVVKKQLLPDRSLSEIQQILSTAVFEKEPLNQPLTRNWPQEDTCPYANQLNLFNL